MYDWANSVYATIMMAAVFPIYFSNVAGAAGQQGDTWWSLGTSIATAVVAVLAPVMGALADFKGYKKKLFCAYLFLGLGATLFSAVFVNWRLLLVGYILSHIGFSGGNLVYDSFLTDVTTHERMDRISGLGYAFGYIGGSTIPFLASIALITFGENFGIDATLAIRISVVIAVLWWGAFSIPFLKNVHQKYGIEKPESGVLKETFLAVGRTAKKIVQNKSIFYYILAYFFYIDGVGTVISMSTAYGATLGLDATGMILALLVTQIVAFPCSIWFSKLTKKFGALRMITFAVLLYVCICSVGFVMGYNIERAEIPVKNEALASYGVTVENPNHIPALDTALVEAGVPEDAWKNDSAYVQAIATSSILFWVLAVMVGTVQGGIQAISRSYYGKLVPPENSGEFFGFFDIFGKFATVMGPLLYAAVKTLVGRSSIAILSIALLFLVALGFLIAGRKHLVK